MCSTAEAPSASREGKTNDDKVERFHSRAAAGRRQRGDRNSEVGERGAGGG